MRLRLLDRDDLVGVAVDHQGRRVVGRDVVDRGDFVGDLAQFLGVGDRDPEGGLLVAFAVVEGRAIASGRDRWRGSFPFAGLAPVQEVGGGRSRRPPGPRLRLTIDRVLGVRVPWAARRPEHQGEGVRRRTPLSSPIRLGVDGRSRPHDGG